MKTILMTILSIISFILFWSIPFLFSGCCQPCRIREKLDKEYKNMDRLIEMAQKKEMDLGEVRGLIKQRREDVLGE